VKRRGEGPPRPRKVRSRDEGARDKPVGDGRPGTRRKSAPRSAAPVDKEADRKPRKPAPKPRRVPAEPGAGGVGGTVKAKPEGPMRVQRALARAGLVSRREADRAVAEGRVHVNGNVALVGQTIDPAVDRVTLDGKPVRLAVEAHRWIVLHKPAAVMTTRKDPAGRKTVFDLVDQVPGLVYVGRLDFMTEGVLLLTTDGKAAHALTHPSNEVERSYVATVRGDAPTAVREARRGVRLEDGMVVPREVSAHPIGDRRWAFEVTIAEGRTHEVRRLCDALGLEVERLVRTQFGPVRLGNLAPGATRALTSAERDVLEALVPSR
jgi:23S rRNA pseudouridine2605 synthase